jgi:hypothetical protein
MTAATFKAAGTLLLVFCLLATGFLTYKVAHPPSPTALQPEFLPLPPGGKDALAAPAAVVENQAGDPLDEADAPIEVAGRVLDPAGKPFAGAKLYVGYSVRRSAPEMDLPQAAPPLRTTTGTDGRFRFKFTKSELDARYLNDSRPAVVAVSRGYGPDWAEIGDSDKSVDLSLKLVEDFPVNGRILDQNGQPIAKAQVLVREVSSDSEEGVTRYLGGDNNAWHPRRWRGPFPEQPLSAATDVDGRFRLTGLGRDRIVSLALAGPAIQHTSLTAVIRPSTAIPNSWRDNAATFDYRALPSQSIRGVVRDKATGRPVAGVAMCAFQGHPPTFTDKDGHFEIRGCPKMSAGYAVMAQPQAGQPYFAAKTFVPDRPGFDPLKADVDLLSGIPLRGRVTDQATGKPPRAGVVEYYPLFPNPHGAKLTYCPALAASSSVIQPDGSYSLIVLPGPGVVCVAGCPRNSYAVAVVDDRELADFFHDGVKHGGNQCLTIAIGADGRRHLDVNQYHALSLINPDERTGSLALDLTLQPGRLLRGTVVGPDGEPLTGVSVVGLSAMPAEERLESGTFTVMGLNPRHGRELVFRHRGKCLGKLLTIRRDHTAPLTVQLEPCGTVLGRLVDKEGKPIPGVYVGFARQDGGPEVTAETDPKGCFRGVLLPGQKYSICVLSSRRLLREVGELEVESGRSNDLGDLPLGD